MGRSMSEGETPHKTESTGERWRDSGWTRQIEAGARDSEEKVEGEIAFNPARFNTSDKFCRRINWMLPSGLALRRLLYASLTARDSTLCPSSSWATLGWSYIVIVIPLSDRHSLPPSLPPFLPAWWFRFCNHLTISPCHLILIARLN